MRVRTAEEEAAGPWAVAAGRDRLAFGLLIVFILNLYAAPAEWMPALAPLRLALTPSALALGLLLVVHVGRRLPIRADGARGLLIAAFLAWAVASRSWSVDPALTTAWVVSVVKAVLAWFLVVNLVTTPRRLRAACLALVAGCIVTSTGTIERYLSGEHLSQGFRALWLGGYGDPNYAAEYIGITVPLAVAFLAHAGERRRVKLLCGVALLLGLTAIVLTFSRGGFLGLVLGLVVWAARERAQRRKALVFAALLAVGVGVFAPDTYWERNQSVEDFQTDESALGRVHAWGVASAASADRPLRGVGGGAFIAAWPTYAPPGAGHALVAHNIFLDSIAELGWVGFLLVLALVGSATGAVFRAGSDPDVGWLARGLGASVAGYLLCNCFAGSLNSPHLYLLLGLAGAAERVAQGGPGWRAGAAGGTVPDAVAAAGRGVAWG